MNKTKALVVIDIQNDTHKNYKEIIANINTAIAWAVKNDIIVVYIKHENLSAGSKLFLPNTSGAELATDLKVVSKNIFLKNKSNALTSGDFVQFIKENEINEFILMGADATICVKSTCFNLRKLNHTITVLADCVSCWDKKQIPEILKYYENQGSKVITTKDL